MGTLVQQFSQAVYTAHKVFRVVQPNALQDSKQVEINVPMYNDLGEAIGKWKDYSAAKFDVRIVSGSTLPINRWAYLDELKELMQLGVIDDIALLSETDIRNKEKIAERKSQYAQMQGQLGSQEEQIKDLTGTIETLERQLVQAGIKSKVQDAEVEINKKKESVKSDIEKHRLQTEAEAKFAGKVIRDEVGTTKRIINQQKTQEMARMRLDLEQVLLEAKNNKEELAE
jgi:putative cell wall-binding protein